jgi:hypothetical protein
MSPIALSAAMELLTLAFFVVAGIWLVASYFDCIVKFIFSRLQASGHLNNPDDEDFGRFFLFHSTVYIPFGWMFCDLAQRDQQNNDAQANEQCMTVVERRAAMERLLLQMLNKRQLEQEHTTVVIISTEDVCDENSSDMVPCCCICFGEYQENDRIFHGVKCSHEFHANCILDWLQQLGKVHCPCCRIPIINEKDVEKTVRCMRDERQNQHSHHSQRSKSSPFGNSEDSDDSINEDGNVDV